MDFDISTVSAAIAPCAHAPFSSQVQPLRASPRSRSTLARRRRGAVVNADSMQVYRDLRIVTARPTIEEEAAAPHLLFGHVDAATNYSVGRWLEDLAARSDATSMRANVTPILVGGTGMYFRAALYGLSDIPAVPGEVRGSDARLGAGQDPAAASCRTRRARSGDGRACCGKTDPQRMLRALEVFEATGKPLVSFQGPRSPPLLKRVGMRRPFFSRPSARRSTRASTRASTE